MSGHTHSNKVTAGTLLVTLGIIYGDIGTSPLYVLKAVMGSQPISSTLVLGGLSCVFWTITLLTTIKYVLITLNADNNGEGGIFSLYALVRRMKAKWLIFPAILGGCTLLADGIITPPISVSSAIEGLSALNKAIPTIPIVIAIITGLFFIQQFGTKTVGRFFGPVMLVWFSMLLVLGALALSSDFSVLRALNPYYAYDMLANTEGGFFLLGAVFLCTTGAEALYSDLGHCGRQNVRISWIMVKTSLLVNYFGQGAWLLAHEGKTLQELGGVNPFFAIMPDWFLIPGIIISALAAIVASQALISGSFTLINEAIRLNFWPKVKVLYPTDVRGQLYIPMVNWMLWAGCVGVVLYFHESAAMEAAYGLAIVLTMLMTTTLLAFYMKLKKFPFVLIALIVLFFLAVEGAFMAANLEKFPHGGYVTLIVAFALFLVMAVWHFGKRISNRFADSDDLAPYVPTLMSLSADDQVPKYATNLVFMTNEPIGEKIEKTVIYSILKRQPKRADIYWFLHVHVTDDPYTMEYKVNIIVPDDIIRVDFFLGFRVEPRINLFFRKVIENMTSRGEVNINSKYGSLASYKDGSDFRFVLIEKYLSGENDLPSFERILLQGYFLLKKVGIAPATAFGLETSSVSLEKFPLIVKPANVELRRVEDAPVAHIIED